MKLKRALKDWPTVGFWETVDGRWRVERPHRFVLVIEGGVTREALRQLRYWTIVPGIVDSYGSVDFLKQNGLWQVRFPTRKVALSALAMALGEEDGQ